MNKKSIAIFTLSFAVAFGGGYLFWKSDSSESTSQHKVQPAANKQSEQSKAPAQDQNKPAAQPTASTDGKVFSELGCTGCHAVSSLGVQGGATGPDLSKAYSSVKGKHGVELDEFLKKPTSAVMSGVIGGKPLTDDQRKSLVEALKKADEAK